MEHDGILPRWRACNGTPAMGVPFETEFTALKPASRQQSRLILEKRA
jgi:hypothetical protein